MVCRTLMGIIMRDKYHDTRVKNEPKTLYMCAYAVCAMNYVKYWAKSFVAHVLFMSAVSFRPL